MYSTNLTRFRKIFFFIFVKQNNLKNTTYISRIASQRTVLQWSSTRRRSAFVIVADVFLSHRCHQRIGVPLSHNAMQCDNVHHTMRTHRNVRTAVTRCAIDGRTERKQTLTRTQNDDNSVRFVIHRNRSHWLRLRWLCDNYPLHCCNCNVSDVNDFRSRANLCACFFSVDAGCLFTDVWLTHTRKNPKNPRPSFACWLHNGLWWRTSACVRKSAVGSLARSLLWPAIIMWHYYRSKHIHQAHALRTNINT